MAKKPDSEVSKYGKKKRWCHRKGRWGWEVQAGKPWGGHDFVDRAPWFQRERHYQPLTGPWV